MAGRDIYEENKRLKAEIERMQQDARHTRLRRDQLADETGELFLRAASSFLRGIAAFQVSAGPEPGMFFVGFQMPDQSPPHSLTEEDNG